MLSSRYPTSYDKIKSDFFLHFCLSVKLFTCIKIESIGSCEVRDKVSRSIGDSSRGRDEFVSTRWIGSRRAIAWGICDRKKNALARGWVDFRFADPAASLEKVKREQRKRNRRYFTGALVSAFTESALLRWYALFSSIDLCYSSLIFVFSFVLFNSCRWWGKLGWRKCIWSSSIPRFRVEEVQRILTIVIAIETRAIN